MRSLTARTNKSIISHALKGESAITSHGSMATGRLNSSGALSYSWLNVRLRSILEARRDKITQVIYSYDTPIAWLDSGVWVRPDATYSVITSVKHQTHLWLLRPRSISIPFDCGLDEYLSYLTGRSAYNHGKITAGPVSQ